jgi:hypothetical protein
MGVTLHVTQGIVHVANVSVVIDLTLLKKPRESDVVVIHAEIVAVVILHHRHLVLLGVSVLLHVHPVLVLQKVQIIIVKTKENIVVVWTIVMLNMMTMMICVILTSPIPSALLLQVGFIYVLIINQMQHGLAEINAFPFQKTHRSQRL